MIEFETVDREWIDDIPPGFHIHNDETVSDFNSEDLRRYMKQELLKFIRRCNATAGRPMHEGIMRYLFLVVENLPMKYYITAQSPYDDSILPQFASAFAFDARTDAGYPATVQVMGQFLSLNPDIDINNVLYSMSVSAIFAFCNTIFINCISHNDIDDAIQRKLETYFAEFCRELIISSIRSGADEIIYVSFGDVASRVADMIKSSLDTNQIHETRVRWMSFPHPVWLSRSCKGRQRIVPVHNDVQITYDEIRPKVKSVYRYKRYSKTQTWTTYSHDDLLRLGNPSRLKWLSNMMTNNNINNCRSKLILQAGIKMPKEVYDNTDIDAMALNKLRNINKNTQHMLEIVQDIRDKIYVSLDGFNSDDKSQVQQFLDHLASCSRSLTNVNGLFMAMPGVLTSVKPAVSLTGKNVPPVIKTRVSNQSTVNFQPTVKYTATPIQEKKDNQNDVERVTNQMSNLDLSVVDSTENISTGAQSVSELGEFETGNVRSYSDFDDEPELFFDEAPLTLGVEKKQRSVEHLLKKLGKMPAVSSTTTTTTASSSNVHSPKPVVARPIPPSMRRSPSSSSMRSVTSAKSVVSSGSRKFTPTIKSVTSSPSIKPRPKLIARKKQ